MKQKKDIVLPDKDNRYFYNDLLRYIIRVKYGNFSVSDLLLDMGDPYKTSGGYICATSQQLYRYLGNINKLKKSKFLDIIYTLKGNDLFTISKNPSVLEEFCQNELPVLIQEAQEFYKLLSLSSKKLDASLTAKIQAKSFSIDEERNWYESILDKSASCTEDVVYPVQDRLDDLSLGELSYMYQILQTIEKQYWKEEIQRYFTLCDNGRMYFADGLHRLLLWEKKYKYVCETYDKLMQDLQISTMEDFTELKDKLLDRLINDFADDKGTVVDILFQLIDIKDSTLKNKKFWMFYSTLISLQRIINDKKTTHTETNKTKDLLDEIKKSLHFFTNVRFTSYEIEEQEKEDDNS